MVADERIARRLERSLTVTGKARSGDGRLEPRTRAKYIHGWKQWEEWRRPLGHPAIATSETLALYTADLLEQGYARSTIDGRLSAVKARHRERGWPVPDGVAAWYVLRGGDPTPEGADKVIPRSNRRVVALAACAAADVSTPAGLRDRCLVTLLWALIAREAEAVALDLEDVEHTGSGLRVRVGERVLPVTHDHSAEPALLCAVCATEAWIRELAGAGSRSGPLLRSVDKGQNIGGCGRKGGATGEGGRLNVRGLQRIWARLTYRAGFAGVHPSELRLGGAEEAVARGMTVWEVLMRGGWSPLSAAVVRRLVLVEVAAAEGQAGG